MRKNENGSDQSETARTTVKPTMWFFFGRTKIVEECYSSFVFRRVFVKKQESFRSNNIRQIWV